MSKSQCLQEAFVIFQSDSFGQDLVEEIYGTWWEEFSFVSDAMTWPSPRCPNPS